MDNIDWEDFEALESIANQSIYNGKEVGRARAALLAIYGYYVIYKDELDENELPNTNNNLKKKGLF